MPTFPLPTQIGRFLAAGRGFNYGTFARKISTVRQLALPAFRRAYLEDPQLVCHLIRNRIYDCEKSGAFQISNPNRMTVISFPEFALCGEEGLDEFGNVVWTFSGKNTVPLAWRDQIRETIENAAADLSQRRGETIVVLFSTTYDTGLPAPQGEPGQTIATNTLIATTGPTNSVLVDKIKATEADGMGDKIIIPGKEGTPFKIIEIPDGFGDGKSVLVGLKTCVEMTIDGPFNLDDALRAPEVICVVSAGAPYQPYVDKNILLVNEAHDHERSMLQREITGVLTPNHPVAELGEYRSTMNGSVVARVFDWIISVLNVSPSCFAANSHTAVKGNILHKIKPDEGDEYTVIESRSFEIPEKIEQPDLFHKIDTMDARKGVMIDPEALSDDPGRIDPAKASHGSSPPLEPFHPHEMLERVHRT